MLDPFVALLDQVDQQLIFQQRQVVKTRHGVYTPPPEKKQEWRWRKWLIFPKRVFYSKCFFPEISGKTKRKEHYVS